MSGTWITETSVVYARALWDEGIITAEIARRIGDGCTKSAIVGYAHRNGFPPRPSPIIRSGKRAEAVPRVPPKPHRKRTEQQPQLAESNINKSRNQPPNGNTPPQGLEPKRDLLPAAKPQTRVVVTKSRDIWASCRPEPLAVPSPAHRSCQWLNGDDRRSWVFCGAPVARPGVAYCAEHFPRCYHRPPRWSYAPEAVP